MSNSIAIARDLAVSGLPKEQAEVIAEAFATHVGDNLATKAELSEAKKELKADTAHFESEHRTELGNFQAEVRAEFTAIKAEMNSIKTAVVRLEANSRFTFWLASAAFIANLATLAIAVSILLKLTSAA